MRIGGNVSWDPERYVHGNYIQNKINEAFCKRLNFRLFGNILDIGSGDGLFTKLLADNLKSGQILGIDSSEPMVKHARQHWARKNLSFEVQRIEELKHTQPFDFILSFWCLHWTPIELSFPNIYQALKPGGKMYAVFSSFSDNSILQTWRELAKQNRYRDLTDKYISSTNEQYFLRVVNILSHLPFKQVKLNLETASVPLPTLDHFKNLLLTMPFMHTFPAEILNDLIRDMQEALQVICQRKYAGKLYYETRPIFLEAVK